jgi:hypothetical protein
MTIDLHELRRVAKRLEDRPPSLRTNTETLHRQVAMWKAGIRYGPQADLFLGQWPGDVDLDDPEAVRQACAEIAGAALGARRLAEVPA